MQKINFFGKRLNAYKAALHTHSTVSEDGVITPAELIDLYSGAGYDVLAFTDHRRMNPVKEYDGKGMNLTLEVRDGILNHTSRGNAMTLEGHIVSWSDRIAYINHDIDDAVRGGVIKNEDIPKRFRDAFGENNGKRIDSMIMDVITNSFDKDKVEPSPEKKALIGELRQWMFENVYRSPIAKSEEYKAVDMIKYLYEYFYEHFEDKVPDEIQKNVGSKEQKVCDHISMMSDQYAVRVYEDITIPKSWKKY